MDTSRIDLYDPSVYERGIPHEAFAYLRQNAPVHWHHEPGATGFWAVTRYNDVLAVSRDPETFSSHVGTAMLYDYDDQTRTNQQQSILNMDPPDHSRLRTLVNKVFTPRVIAGLEENIRRTCNDILDRVTPKGEADLVHDVSSRLPLAVICELLGVPAEHHDMVYDWSNRLIGFDDPEFATTTQDGELAAFEMFMYANGLAMQREREPVDDIITKLVSPDAEGNRLTQFEFDMFFMLLSVAGNETTRNAISGGMLALLEHPDQGERLLRDRSLLGTAADEIVRWVTPVIEFRRTATRDTVLNGQPIRTGDKVVLFYSSANRDETVFEDADVFDVGRDPNPHLGYGGGGPHFCLGSHLAKLEISVMLETLLNRVPDIELAGPVRRLRSNFVNGIKEMPVRFTPSGATR